MFNCFGCGLCWQMLCCIKFAFLKIFHLHGCHFSLPAFFFFNSIHSQCLSIKAGQVGLLSNAVLWCFESACDGFVQKIKSSGLFMQVLSIWVDLLLLWNAVELNSWIEWISACFAFSSGSPALWTAYFALCLFVTEPWFLINMVMFR